tara:strand:+ start:27 stop:515 length:489 start_codon:yes stop_codon:yes gene_type:complete
MAIKTSELTQMIADQVTKDVAKKLIPKLRRIVREEIDRSIKDMLYEMVVKQQTPLRNNNFVEDNTTQFNEETQLENVSAAKNFIAQRQASRAKSQQILGRKFKSDDPMASLIMDVEDPQEELNLQQEQLMTSPMKKVADVNAGDKTMPENIDYSQHMERLIP